MNYFQAYLPSLDEAIVAAWESQVAEAAETPWLAQALATKSTELLPRFAASYAKLRALPRGARRTMQRQLARSCELAEMFPGALPQKLARSLAGAALLLALGQGTAQAVDITLTTNKPKINPDGLCSLIEAILNANNDNQTASTDCPAGSGADKIILQPNTTHTLTYAYVPNYYGPTGLPVITSNITIEGQGGSKIARRGTGPAFRIIAVEGGGDLTLRNVTISGGRTTDVGGAIFTYGTLTVEDSIISGNKAGSGGAIFVDDDATATITNSTISGNRTTYGAGGILTDKSSSITIQNSTISGNKARFYGGGITNAGEATITDSTISGNKTKFAGGGLYNDYFIFSLTSYFGTATITNTTISGNKARYGAGLFNDYHSTMTVNNSVISGNKPSRVGGGILNNADGILTVNNSTISGNTASRVGGGIFNDYYFFNGTPYKATATINNSTISGNKATRSGGGILNDYFAVITIENSTISGNTATTLYGGGIYNTDDAVLTVNHSTIAENKAKRDGGGISNVGSVDLNRTLISGNTAASGREVYNYALFGGTVTANNYNIFGVGGVSGLYDVTVGATDIVPAGALSTIIDPLANNGGPTYTRALPVGSPAIDAAPDDAGCPAADQRGTLRPQGALCDIGAFEKGP